MSHIFKESIETADILDELKFGDVAPVYIYKKGMKNKIISLLIFYLLYLKYLKVVSATKTFEENRLSKSQMGTKHRQTVIALGKMKNVVFCL